MENSLQLFELALGLTTSWSIQDAIFNQEKSRLGISLGYQKGYKFIIPNDISYTAHNTL